jgi:hypothetical protein
MTADRQNRHPGTPTEEQVPYFPFFFFPFFLHGMALASLIIVCYIKFTPK